MHESGATEEEARGYIKEMIRDAWKKLNKERALANSQVSREYIEYATNMARMAQFIWANRTNILILLQQYIEVAETSGGAAAAGSDPFGGADDDDVSLLKNWITRSNNIHSF
ncbi:hypothetical protein L1987_81639 [Smallanthus sonchifolius]|uniref:Uncharacterized protein n=1 Tax=Smallanthus sonchifolius TaxID=185202 RepID=A0ACB8YRF3_9ASTR|nr:hypothetical protein L1987_81639 [Smallanthus sonchifolius]